MGLGGDSIIVQAIVDRVKSILPYTTGETDSIQVNMGLGRITVLLGPNASGKTSILESIGYSLATIIEPAQSILALALTSSLRPLRHVPGLAASSLEVRGKKLSTIILEPNPRILLSSQEQVKLSEALHYIGVDDSISFDTLLDDVEFIVDALTYDENISGRDLPRRAIRVRLHLYSDLRRIVRKILGETVTIYETNPIFGVKDLSSVLDEVEHDEPSILRYRFSGSIKVLYTVYNSKLYKSIVIDSFRKVLIAQVREIYEDLGVVVFHPGFIYWPGFAEGLYKYYAKSGLPGERDAALLLRKYIKWFDGFEVLRKLHLRSLDGRRVPVYSLSDGQRMAAFLGLLYALFKPPAVALIDTPEAFVHPDGLPVVADLLVGLVDRGGQLVVATQSIEFLRELLARADKHGLLDETIVQRVDLSAEGIVEARGRWSGRLSLDIINELGADLRR